MEAFEKKLGLLFDFCRFEPDDALRGLLDDFDKRHPGKQADNDREHISFDELDDRPSRFTTPKGKGGDGKKTGRQL